MKKLVIMLALVAAMMTASCGHMSAPGHSDSDSTVYDTIRANEILMDTVPQDTVLICEVR